MKAPKVRLYMRIRQSMGATLTSIHHGTETALFGRGTLWSPGSLSTTPKQSITCAFFGATNESGSLSGHGLTGHLQISGTPNMISIQSLWVG